MSFLDSWFQKKTHLYKSDTNTNSYILQAVSYSKKDCCFREISCNWLEANELLD